MNPTPALSRSLPGAVLLVGLLLSAASPSFGQQSDPCASGPFREFDFWVGEWQVTQKDGTAAGENTIRKILNDCVLHENWRGTSGSIGQSFNQYDWQEGKWKQTWVDGQGLRLDLVGGMEGESMVLRGERPNPRGEGTLRSEIRWIPQDDGSVVQQWRVSSDGGSTWSEAFYGIYRRVGE